MQAAPPALDHLNYCPRYHPPLQRSCVLCRLAWPARTRMHHHWCAPWGACQVSLGLHVCCAVRVTRGCRNTDVAIRRSPTGLRRVGSAGLTCWWWRPSRVGYTSESSLTRECRALPVEEPHRENRQGQVSLRLGTKRLGEVMASSWCQRPAGTTRARVSVRHGASKGGASAQLELAVRDDAAGEIT